MEQALGWERPAYFIKDRTAPVRRYDWYGHYDHVANEINGMKKNWKEISLLISANITIWYNYLYSLVRE